MLNTSPGPSSLRSVGAGRCAEDDNGVELRKDGVATGDGSITDCCADQSDDDEDDDDVQKLAKRPAYPLPVQKGSAAPASLKSKREKRI